MVNWMVFFYRLAQQAWLASNHIGCTDTSMHRLYDLSDLFSKNKDKTGDSPVCLTDNTSMH